MFRPAVFFAAVVAVLVVGALGLAWHGMWRAHNAARQAAVADTLVSGLGLSDLCLTTEARYTRHPALSDDLAPFMDYPAALEHFPSGLFWAPP